MEIKRLDHLSIVAGVIKDLGFVEAIDIRLQVDEMVKKILVLGKPLPE